MNTFYAVFAFIFGTVFGSFYNVVIYRLPAQLPIANDRSMCFSCKHKLGALDLIPLISYIFLGGKCRYCKAKISPRYFIIELVTGLLFLVSFLKFGLSINFLVAVVFLSCLIIVAMIDLDTSSIYDIVLVIFGCVLAVILIFQNGFSIFLKENLIGAIIGFAIYYLIYFVSKIIYKQEAFGYGDVLLNTFIGLYLGKLFIIVSSFLSFIIALIFIGILTLLGKKFSLKAELPFGPYMCLSALMMTFYGQMLIDWYISNILGL